MYSLKRSIVLYLTVALTTVVFISCASVKTTMHPTWKKEIGYPKKLVPDPNGQAVLVYYSRKSFEKGGLEVLNGKNGNILTGKETEGTSFLDEATDINGVSLKELWSKNYDFQFLPQQDLLLVLFSSSTHTEVYCVDLKTKKTLWSTGQFRWTLENFAGFGKEASSVLKTFGLGAAIATNTASQVLTKHKALSRLLIPVPEMHAFLFRTLGKLQLVDSRSGKVLWTSKDVPGSGFTHVKYVPKSNDLLLITMSTGVINNENLITKLVRVDGATGAVKWTADYAGRDDMIQGLNQEGNYVLISYQGGLGEVINYETGEQVLTTKDNMETALGNLFKHSIMNMSVNAAPVFLKDAVCAAQVSSFKVVGNPDWVVQKFDLKSGQLVWESDPLKSKLSVTDLQVVDGQVLVTAPGGKNQVMALDPESGKQLWTFSPDDMILTDVVIDGDNLYTGTAKTLYRLDAHSGKVLAQSDFSANKISKLHQLQEVNNDLAAIGYDGIAYYSTPDLHVETVLTFPMSASPVKIYDDECIGYLSHFGKYKGMVFVDLPKRHLDGFLKFETEMKQVPKHPQLLHNGYFLSHAGHAVYMFDGDNLVRYTL